MATNQKAVVKITIKKSKRKTQAWDFTINKPGNNPEEKNTVRYTDDHCALRGALRQLGAWKGTLTGPHQAVIKGKTYQVEILTQFKR
jgi:hypothetical protein